jgi:hypothetical protein
MKTLTPLILLLLCITTASAQHRPTLGILPIEGRGVLQDAATLGSMARIEMAKTQKFDVLDWQDIREMLKSNNVDLDNCFGRICVQEAGRMLKADKMLLGSVERFGERIAITLKIMDVASGTVENSNTTEYQNIQPEMQRMFEISTQQLVGMQPSRELTENLLAYDDPIDSPVTKVNLSGPRIGVFYTEGLAGIRMRGAKVHGGLEMAPVNSVLGWQQEIQYLSSGNFQALFEFLFTVSGLESGRFIPAFSFLNGFRMGKAGWEIALGPIFRVVKTAEGWYEKDEAGNFDPMSDWHLANEYSTIYEGMSLPENLKTTAVDHRGDIGLSTGLLIGFGRTFRSGQLNIPVNAYVIPRDGSTTYGLSVGFNVFQSSRK